MSIPPSRHPNATLTTGRRPAADPIAVTADHLASEAALEIMAAGGSAVDGAIAANAVLGMVAPDTCGIGGDLFAIVHEPGDSIPAALNASGRAGSGATAAELRPQGFVDMPLRHPATVTVPGCIDGWEALQARYGRLPLSRLLEPAIRLGEEGFPVSAELAGSLERIQSLVAAQPSARALYPDDAPPAAGDTLRRPGLAATMRSVGDSGRAAFYEGEVAQAITSATGGLIRAGDLAAVQADWVEPLSIDVFSMTGWTIPPNSQGYLTLAAAAVLEALDAPRDPNDPEYVHLCIEAYRCVAWERDAVVSDQAHMPHEAAWYLDRERLRDRAGSVARDVAGTWPGAIRGSGGTTYLCTADSSGMFVSFIQSNFHGIGSGLSAGDTGVFLHNRGAGFTLEEGHSNELLPGRRPLHTLSPTLWTAGGEVRMVLGIRGGSHQPQLLSQMLAHLEIAGLDGADAQAVPRWTVDGFAPDDDHTVTIEPAAAATVIEGLQRRGHEVETAPAPQPGWGPISFIRSTPDGRAGFADPRVLTSAARSMAGRGGSELA